MKRHLQFVAILVISLLTARPALAGLTCNMATTGPSPECSHHMPAMAATCPMSHGMRASGCTSSARIQDCCTNSAAATFAAVAAPGKTKLAAVTQVIQPALAVFAPQSRQASTAFGPPRSSPPPHYILNHTFRI